MFLDELEREASWVDQQREPLQNVLDSNDADVVVLDSEDDDG